MSRLILIGSWDMTISVLSTGGGQTGQDKMGHLSWDAVGCRRLQLRHCIQPCMQYLSPNVHSVCPWGMDGTGQDGTSWLRCHTKEHWPFRRLQTKHCIQPYVQYLGPNVHSVCPRGGGRQMGWDGTSLLRWHSKKNFGEPQSALPKRDIAQWPKKGAGLNTESPADTTASDIAFLETRGAKHFFVCIPMETKNWMAQQMNFSTTNFVHSWRLFMKWSGLLSKIRQIVTKLHSGLVSTVLLWWLCTMVLASAWDKVPWCCTNAKSIYSTHNGERRRSALNVEAEYSGSIQHNKNKAAPKDRDSQLKSWHRETGFGPHSSPSSPFTCASGTNLSQIDNSGSFGHTEVQTNSNTYHTSKPPLMRNIKRDERKFCFLSHTVTSVVWWLFYYWKVLDEFPLFLWHYSTACQQRMQIY